MNEPPSVSVVIPCFNDGQFLNDCLRSVLAQTLKPTETLIINDGSTDPKTIKFLQNIDLPSVRIIHQQNRGLSGARNTGIRNARGEYLYFLDADDVIYPVCLAKLAWILKENESAVAAASKIRILGSSHHRTVWGTPSNPYFILVKNQWAASIMLRKEAIEKYGLWYDESMRTGYEDWELGIRLVKTGRPVLFCPEPLYEYRVRKRSLLSISRKHQVDIVTYIRNKHADCYTYDRMLNLKRSNAPALVICCPEGEQPELENWLNDQTFRDWTLMGYDTTIAESPYRFLYSNPRALQRLPREALECALMVLESYPRLSHCVIAARETCLSLFATAAKVTRVEGKRYPIALISRTSIPGLNKGISEILSNCELIIEFPDQNPGCAPGWEKDQIHLADKFDRVLLEDVDAFRKDLSSLGKKILSPTIHRTCVRFYDYLYYRILSSERMFSLRKKIKSALGRRTERYLSNFFYGIFLTKPPLEEKIEARRVHDNSSDEISPLFLTPPDDRIHILVATAWLIEGGVEQIIFELCRLLDPALFRITIVTTLPSSHAWDVLARRAGASVYHLADILKPSEMVNGLLHLVINHRIDCLYIMNSEITYRAARVLKRMVPWLPIIDRIEAPDPGGGFPLVSAKLGAEFIDLRTVSHKRLAEYMCKNYGLSHGAVRVIYIGANLNRIDQVLARQPGLLHKKCGVSPDTPIVIFIGRFAEQKRPEAFVRLVAKILEVQPACNAHFAMVGDGVLMDSMKRLIARSELDGRIHLLGAAQNAADLLADATILMMPSAYEGVALVSYEAMALGVPQIFADVGGQSELITPETGILIKSGPGEETRYAQACLDLLSDPDRRARMAAAGKERIRSNFTAENAVKQYALIFEKMADLSRKRAAEIPHLRPPHINPLHALT